MSKTILYFGAVVNYILSVIAVFSGETQVAYMLFGPGTVLLWIAVAVRSNPR